MNMITDGKSRLFLKRCGAKSTIEGMVDVFRLTKPRTVIGRNSSQADFYLNSSINKCLISRQHAVILLVQNISGSVNLFIRDQSLNGTFVNDVKIHGTVSLQLGDVITFGHINGAGLKPGMHSPQPNSEFSFILQESSDSSSTPSILSDTVEPTSSVNSKVGNELGTSPLQTESMCTSIAKSGKPLLPSNTRKTQGSPVSAKSSIRNSSGTEVKAHFHKVTSQCRDGMTVKIPGFSLMLNNPRTDATTSTTCPVTDDLSIARKQPTSSSKCVSPVVDTSQNMSPTSQSSLQRTNTSANASQSSVYLSPTLHSTPITSERLPHWPTPSPTNRGRQKHVPTRIVYSSSVHTSQDKQHVTNSNIDPEKNVSKDSGIYDDFRELDGEGMEDMATDSDGSDDDIFALASVVQAKLTNITDDDDNFSPNIPDSQSSMVDNVNHHADGLVLPGLNITRDGNAVHSKSRTKSPLLAMSTSPVIELIVPLDAQQKVITRHGQKRKNGNVNVILKKPKMSTKSTGISSHNIPGVEVEVCSSFDCSRPLQKKKKVAWVQCDDCDEWYHVDCVGCNYNKVKQSSATFRCGCI